VFCCDHLLRMSNQAATLRLLADANDEYGCLPPAGDADSAGGESLPESLPPLRLSEVLGSPEVADAACGSAAPRQAALLAAVRLIGRLAALLHNVVAFPELFGPARAALEALGARPGVHRVRHRHARSPAFITGSKVPCSDVTDGMLCAFLCHAKRVDPRGLQLRHPTFP